MLDLTDHFWAFRYRNTNEPALLVFSESPLFIGEILGYIERQKITRYNSVRFQSLSQAEWNTWQAFKLCPTIEIHLLEPRKLDQPFDIGTNLTHSVIEP